MHRAPPVVGGTSPCVRGAHTPPLIGGTISPCAWSACPARGWRHLSLCVERMRAPAPGWRNLSLAHAP